MAAETKREIVYSIQGYTELKERIALSFWESILLYFSQTAKKNSSALIAMYDSLIAENRMLSKQINIWEANIEQIRNFTLDHLLSDKCHSTIEKERRVPKYTIKRYMEEIKVYEKVIAKKKELLKSTQEIYQKHNAFRLFCSLYDCVNAGKRGIIMYFSDLNLDQKNINRLVEYSLNSSDDIILFNEYGIDEYKMTFFGDNYKGVVIKKSCRFEDTVDFIQSLAKNEITKIFIREF